MTDYGIGYFLWLTLNISTVWSSLYCQHVHGLVVTATRQFNGVWSRMFRCHGNFSRDVSIPEFSTGLLFMNEWLNEWLNEWMNEWMNEWRMTERREGMFIRPSVCLSSHFDRQSVSQLVNPFVCSYVSASVRRSVRPSVIQSISQSVSQLVSGVVCLMKSKLSPNCHCRYPTLQDRWRYQTAKSFQRCSAPCPPSLRETWLESRG